MKTLIIGGGKVGFNLFKLLKEKNYEVVIVERDKDTCLKIAEDISADVICGDGTDLDVLNDAGIEEAEIIAAVTGTDEENLVICQIAKTCFNTNKTIARVNNPKNIEMFKTLGIDNIVCSTEVIANLVEFELDRNEYKIVTTFERGSMFIAEIEMDSLSNWCNKTIKDLVLPEECLIVSILRANNVIYPKGDTEILDKDKVLIITNKSALAEIITGMHRGGKKYAEKKR